MVSLGLIAYSLFYFWTDGYADFKQGVYSEVNHIQNESPKKKQQLPIMDDSVQRWQAYSPEQTKQARLEARIQLDSLQHILNQQYSVMVNTDFRSDVVDLETMRRMYQRAGWLLTKIEWIDSQLSKGRQSPHPIDASASSVPPITENDSQSAAVPSSTQTSITIQSLAVNWLDEKGDPTEDASDARQIRGTVRLAGERASLPTGKLFITIVDPDGDVLLSQQGQSGKFEFQDHNEPYSLRLDAIALTQDGRDFSFSMHYDDFEDGKYTINLYGSGMLIGSRRFTLE